MTRETAKKFLPIIEAYANGETIEVLTHNHNEWRAFSEISIHDSDDVARFRVKPKPLELWVNIYALSMNAYTTEDEALRNRVRDGRTVHMREVV